MLQPLVVGSMSTNAYIYSENGKDCYVIDPGGDQDLIISEILAGEYSVAGILCTHGHLDHTSAVGPLMEWCAGREEKPFLAIHEDDRNYLGTQAEQTHRTSFQALGIVDTGFFTALYNPSPEATLMLRDGERVPDTGLQILHTPGHSEGSVCFYNESENMLIAGDTLFYRGMGRTDLPGGSGRKIAESIKNKLFTLPDDTAVYPGHGPQTVIGDEKSQNPFIR